MMESIELYFQICRARNDIFYRLRITKETRIQQFTYDSHISTSMRTNERNLGNTCKTGVYVYASLPLEELKPELDISGEEP